MKRKVFSNGLTALGITLPSKWHARYNLKKGDVLSVNEEGNKLIIETDTKPAENKKTIDTADFGKFISNHVSTLYHLGYDEITFNYKNYEELMIIKGRLPHLIGFEIIEQKEHSLTIKNLLGESQETFGNFENILKRTFSMLSDLSLQVFNALKTKNYSAIKETRELEAQNNKLTGYCLRLLNKFGYENKKRTPSAYTFIEDLEELADEYKQICDILSKNPKFEASKKFIVLFEKINDYIENFRVAFFINDKARMARLIDERFLLLKEADKIYDNATGDEARLLHNSINIITKAYECMCVYFEIKL